MFDARDQFRYLALTENIGYYEINFNKYFLIPMSLSSPPTYNKHETKKDGFSVQTFIKHFTPFGFYFCEKLAPSLYNDSNISIQKFIKISL